MARKILSGQYIILEDTARKTLVGKLIFQDTTAATGSTIPTTIIPRYYRQLMAQGGISS